MFTVVLDDDPTGTQAATDVSVALDWTTEELVDVLQREHAVYLQTNSRAIDERSAVDLAREIQGQIRLASARLGERVLVVLRGDSTLRGHVFAESDVFADGRCPVLFVPAFPAGGRTTIASIHRVVIDGRAVPAGETEFARDPVFSYSSSNLIDYAREKGARNALAVQLSQLRESRGAAVAAVLANASPGEFVVPDVETDADIELVHYGVNEHIAKGGEVVVRCAAPLAAMCAGHLSREMLNTPLTVPRGPVLFVCGSHTEASTKQLQTLSAFLRIDPLIISTDDALRRVDSISETLVARLSDELNRKGAAILATERVRRESDGSLQDGSRVMSALMRVTAEVLALAPTVVSKGGITSAEVARTAIGWRLAHVRGQILPGISVWEGTQSGAAKVQVIVPGNIGGPSTLLDVWSALDTGFGQERPG